MNELIVAEAKYHNKKIFERNYYRGVANPNKRLKSSDLISHRGEIIAKVRAARGNAAADELLTEMERQCPLLK